MKVFGVSRVVVVSVCCCAILARLCRFFHTSLIICLILTVCCLPCTQMMKSPKNDATPCVISIEVTVQIHKGQVWNITYRSLATSLPTQQTTSAF